MVMLLDFLWTLLHKAKKELRNWSLHNASGWEEDSCPKQAASVVLPSGDGTASASQSSHCKSWSWHGVAGCESRGVFWKRPAPRLSWHNPRSEDAQRRHIFGTFPACLSYIFNHSLCLLSELGSQYWNIGWIFKLSFWPALSMHKLVTLRLSWCVLLFDGDAYASYVVSKTLFLVASVMLIWSSFSCKAWLLSIIWWEFMNLHINFVL